MQVFKFFAGGVLFTFSILAFLAWVILPNEFEITQQVEIDLPPAKTFAIISDLQTWESWVFDKQVEKAPAANYSTIRAGEGATVVWIYPEGNQVEISIVETKPVEEVKFVFKTPGETDQTDILVTLKRNDEGGTLLIWRHAGEYGWGIAARISASMLDFEGKTAEIYSAQLTRLKSYAENSYR